MKTSAQLITLIAIVLVTVAGVLSPNRPVIKKHGHPPQYVDAIQYRPFSDEYIVTSGRAVIRIPAKDIAYARSAKPPDLDKAVRTDNVNVLSRISKEQHGLGWDVIALRHLVKIHAAADQPQQTVAAFRALRNRTVEIPAELYRCYLLALRNSRQLASLEKELETAITTGPRDLAAMANIIRGDIHMKDGQVRRALVDGYLRTAVLFRDVKGQRREALEKSILALERLHDRRAGKFREQLRREFPGSTT